MNLFADLNDARRALWTAFAAGLLAALAMPPLPFGFMAPLAVALWLLAQDSNGPPFRSGLLFGIGFAAPALFWIGWVTIPGTVALVLIQAAEFGLLAATYRRLQARVSRTLALFAFPCLWVLLEHLRGYGFIGFPWINLAHTQLDYLWLYQFVELTGDLGLSLWVVAMGVLLYLIARERHVVAWLAALLLVTIPVAWGAWRVQHLPECERSARVAILQADIDTYRKWDETYVDSSFAAYDSLTRAVPADVDLIIWPETAAPTYLRQVFQHSAWAEQLSLQVGAPLLIGTLRYERMPERAVVFNSAFEVWPDGHWEGPYSKQQLVPFGEMIPGAQWFPWLSTIDLGQGNFQTGPGPHVFDSAGLPHAVLICYESAFSGLCREQILRGARFLVIITNDSWYGRTPGPAQHAAMASLRAVEFRVGVARAANGGISLWTDRTGRRFDETRLFTRTMITGEIPLGQAPTFYAQHGSWLVWLVAFPATLAIVVAWWPRRRR